MKTFLCVSQNHLQIIFNKVACVQSKRFLITMFNIVDNILRNAMRYL